MGLKTPLYDEHIEMGAKMVDFGGWDMPLHYGSQLDEHHTVRHDAGMFDVSHMTVTDLKGSGVRDVLRMMLANNVDKLKQPGKALYSCMLNMDGGIMDDLIVYYMDEQWYRIVSNAATREKDIAWFHHVAEDMDEIDIVERIDLAMIAVQGPKAREKTFLALGDDLRDRAGDLKPFHAVTVGELFIATTGYTGEDGFEIIMPGKSASFMWQMLAEAGVAPIGLGARDTLRLEAGMALYGSDMDETTTPLEVSLDWTVGWEPEERNYIGRDVLTKQKTEGVPNKLVGLLLTGKGVLRRHQGVTFKKEADGKVTSGGFSPTLKQAVALARAPAQVEIGDVCQVNIRGKQVAAKVVKYPFVRHGKSCLES
ncbi:MAG: glycine cleavage system aminomethyltransferase GcvT [Gammaproteobacteria bacterium]|nr:MAG: glycine cleavage system aminomethyltransferase GcvT [Gammaproteobacteria bacterium]